MEVLLYGIFCVLVWCLSLTILLPFVLLLKFNKKLQSRFFSWVFVRVISAIFQTEFKGRRKRTFEILHENLSNRNENAPLDVLEIGIGGGPNLEYYPENSNLTAVDVDNSFEPYLLESLAKFPEIKHKGTVIARAEDMRKIPDSSMDLVICTFVMCYVSNVHSAVSEVKRVLKPGGKFLFCEHEAFPKKEWGFTLQKFIAPLWRVYSNGCNVDRNFGQIVNQIGWSNIVAEKMVKRSLFLLVRPTLMGIATK